MRKILCKSASAAALLFAACPALASPTVNSRPTVRTLAAEEVRLAEMAYRMATANAPYCARPQIISGLILHDLTQYQPEKRAEVARAFSLNGGFGVLQIVPGSAAARAGLRIDDEILSVGDVSVEDVRAAQSREVSARRAQSFSDLLQARLARGPADLVIRRAGQMQTVRLTGDRGCGGDLSLSQSGSLNAWSDGRHIVLTTGMNNFARSDDEIAFVIAHEMAHNILGHFGGGAKMGIFGVARSRNYELDADGYAVRLMNAAGFQPAAGISFLKRSQQRLWWAFSLDHPGFGSRIRTVANEMQREQLMPAYRQANVGLPRPVSITVAASKATASPAQPMQLPQAAVTTTPAALGLLSPPQVAQSSMWAQASSWRLPGRVPQP